MNIKTNAYLDQVLALLKDGWDSGDKEVGVQNAVNLIADLYIQAHPKWKTGEDFYEWDINVDNGIDTYIDSLYDRSNVDKWLVQDENGETISMFDYDDEIDRYAMRKYIEETIEKKLGKPKSRIVKSILLFPFLLVSWLLKLTVLLGIAGIIVWLICVLTE